MHFLKSQIICDDVSEQLSDTVVSFSSKSIRFRTLFGDNFEQFRTLSNNFEALKTRRRRESDQSRSENLAGTRVHSADYTIYPLSLSHSLSVLVVVL